MGTDMVAECADCDGKPLAGMYDDEADVKL